MEEYKLDQIQIIDSVDSQQLIQSQNIASTLESTRKNLVHGDTFTGKPGTQIYSNDHFVVKLHSELDFNERDAQRWVLKKLEHERTYDIYVPSKTWFLILTDNNPVIANITPLLIPLHQYIQSSDSEQTINLLQIMQDMYFKIAASFGKLLDGGLSNFALNENGKLFYLDDDIYEWDNFTAFCNQTGVIIRQLSDITENQWESFGDFCHENIIKYFHDKHQLTIAYEQLRGVFMASEAQKKSLAAFISGFYKLANKNRSVKTQPTTSETTDKVQSSNFAILADIHANLPALKVVLKELQQQGINEGIILGDIVGYGPHPEECIELLKETDFTVVKGNHDHAIATGIFTGGFSATGRSVAEWSSENISDENKKWLDQLQPYIRHDNWLAVHGSPMDKTFFNGYVYKMTFSDNLDNLQQRDIDICFHGHSHVQGIYYRKKKQDDFCGDSKQNLASYDHSLVCPGSIGQPRGNIPGAEYAIYNTETKDITFYRLEYDMHTTMDDMTSYGFPPQLIQRLPLGK